MQPVLNNMYQTLQKLLPLSLFAATLFHRTTALYRFVFALCEKSFALSEKSFKKIGLMDNKGG